MGFSGTQSILTHWTKTACCKLTFKHEGVLHILFLVYDCSNLHRPIHAESASEGFVVICHVCLILSNISITDILSNSHIIMDALEEFLDNVVAVIAYILFLLGIYR